MELRDMLDVVHFLFEEDSRYKSAEEAESVSAIRTHLYGKLYGQTYKYAVSSKNSSPSNFESGSSDELKPYIPPTEFDPNAANPFGSLLDAPIG